MLSPKAAAFRGSFEPKSKFEGVEALALDPVDLLLVREPASQEHPDAPQAEAEQAEDLDRARPVTHQELHGQEVEEDADRAADPVLRRAPPARPVPDRELADRGPDPAGEGGDE